MTLRSILFALVLITSFVGACAPHALAEDPVYTGRFSNVAVEGHDPVAYFTEGKPVKGDKAIITDWNGAEVRFASEANRDAFVADPAKYAPQYGGYCAWAIADGKYAKGDASHWAIVDDKLYLNYNKGVQNKWNADRPGFITDGDTFWATR